MQPQPRRKIQIRPDGIFYGWWIVVGAFMIQSLNGGLFFQAFQAYFGHLRTDFGWTRTQVALAFSLSRAESGLLGPIQGWMVDRFGTRRILSFGIVLYATGFFVFSRIDTLWQFYGAYLIISLGSSLGGFITVNAALANWFDKRRATAMGLASTGWGVSGLMLPVIVFTLEAIGWRGTAFWSGVIILVVGLPLAQLMRHAPEPYGYLPDGVKPEEVEKEQGPMDGLPATSRPVIALISKGFTTRQALKAPSFWFISLGHAMAMLGVSAINALFIPYVTEDLELSATVGALVFTVLTVVMVISQAISGFLGDRIEKRKIIVVCMGGHTVALLILAFADSVAMLTAFAVIHGLSWGFRGPLMTSIRAEYFGRGSFATIMGWSSMVIQVGTMIGPLFGALVADVTGSYGPAFGVIAFFTAAGAFFFGSARKPDFPDDPTSPTDSEPTAVAAN